MSHGFKVEIIRDSVVDGATPSRLTTFQLRYPRLIHSEFMTHRVISRNASSSRAIPVEKMIKQVREEPAMPVHWGKNQPGMQARAEVEAIDEAHALWMSAAKQAASTAEQMMEIGLHKQVANRILEPFQFISVIATASDWSNFFALRCHPDADPNIQHLANMMKQAYDSSITEELGDNDMHLPYIRSDELPFLSPEEAVKCSVARCARVSYLTHDGENPDMKKDLELYERLAGATPPHLSPLEHQARGALQPDLNGNLNWRWMQFRKCLEIGKPELFWQQ